MLFAPRTVTAAFGFALKLRGVLEDENAVVGLGDELEQRVRERRLAAACAAAGFRSGIRRFFWCSGPATLVFPCRRAEREVQQVVGQPPSMPVSPRT